MTGKLFLSVALLTLSSLPALMRSEATSILPKTAGGTEASDSFDAAPYALPLPEGNGLLWEDPREIHKVVVEFEGAAPDPASVRLEYWGSRWPQQHLPKDREPGGGSVGWMELGNWYKYAWREADADVAAQGSTLAFTFRPVNAKEFKEVKDYPAAFRYTLKLRLKGTAQLPKVRRIQAFTDSTWTQQAARVTFKKGAGQKPALDAFNGEVTGVRKDGAGAWVVDVKTAQNTDPNTFDRTLVTVKSGKNVFTFAVDDLSKGPLFLPQFGAAVLAGNDDRDYAALEKERLASTTKTLYQRVAEMPEQTWSSAWNGIPRKRTHIYFPMGLDGGRQRFRLDANGTIQFRSNDHYLTGLKGKDTPRLSLEPGPVRVSFGGNPEPVDRTIDDASIPVCTTTWDREGYRIVETALVTELGGTRADGPVPAPDAIAVFMARFVFTNTSDAEVTVKLPLNLKAGDKEKALRADETNLLWAAENLRAQVVADGQPAQAGNELVWSWTLGPGKSATAIVKVPYVVLELGEREALTKLDFDAERAAVAGYWRKRLNESARLITPEPMLNEFYRAHAGHLLINCEKEPGAELRFARVGSFGYGAYGNESCMMVVDLDRRGYHREAQECLDAWLHYQGTVMLPGDFASKEGILYGAAGYEAGGYNQHHGWILWMLAEHYRFTRDGQWLQKAAPGILAGADWIIRETKRTLDRHPLERGLLPAGSLEDIGDWWTWLSTSCYSWRGLDSAAWALEQAKHPEAKRVRREADLFHQNLLANFRAASQRSPVVRLRDGTAIPKIPSYVHRRGRSFGWICETLEGALHLMITRAIDARSDEGTAIVEDYEDNLYLSNQYGYTLDNFDQHWFGRGGMSMQACLLLDVEPYLYRDNVKHALRALFNGLAVSYFPDVRMNTEHALPNMEDWAGDHYKSSDESNAAGWLRYLFVREDGDKLLVGQAIPREWLAAGKRCGMDRAATYFGNVSVIYTGGQNTITARLDGPRRNPPKQVLVRFRTPRETTLKFVTVNGKAWKQFKDDWVQLPGDIGHAEVIANY